MADSRNALDYETVNALGTAGGTIRSATGVDANLTLPAPGSAGSLSANSQIFLDVWAPKVVLAMPAARLLSQDAFVMTASFDEPVDGFDDSVLQVTNGAFTSVAKVSDTLFNITITPSGEGDVSVAAATGLAEDRAGNASTAGAKVTALLDISAPEITGMPADIAVDTDPGSDSAVITWTAPSASDDVELASLTPSHAPGDRFPVGTTTVTYVALDTTGNRAEDSFEITVSDAEGPQITGMPGDIAVDTDPGKDFATVSWTEPSASDNVEVTSFTSTHAPGDSFPLGTTTVTYTARDDAGLEATASFKVTVGDGEAPVISGMPADIEVPTDPGLTTAAVSWTEPSATDNVGVTSFTTTHAPGDSFPLGTTTVTYTARDDAGLETDASFQVTVQRRDFVLDETTLTASPDQIMADGSDQSLITVTLYDDVGYPLGYGGSDVGLSTSLGTLGALSDLGDGRYTAVLTSGTRSGTAELTATVAGTEAARVQVTFAVDTAFVNEEVGTRTRAFSQRRISRSFSAQPAGLRLENRRAETPGLRFAAALDAQGGGFSGDFGLAGHLGQRPTGHFNLVDSELAGLAASGSLDGSWMNPTRTWHAWTELTFGRHESLSDGLTTSGSHGALHLGIDRLVTDDLAIGLLLSLDWLDENSSPFDSQEGTGWLAGPYLLAELREGLFLNARLAFGAAQDSGRYDIYDNGTPWSGARDTRRALATLALYGTTDWRGLTLTPQVALFWGGERIGAFEVSDGFGTAVVPEAEVRASRLALSTRVAWQVSRDTTAWVTPALHRTASGASRKSSGAVELGLSSAGTGPWSGKVSLSAEGLGDSSQDSWTLHLGASARF